MAICASCRSVFPEGVPNCPSCGAARGSAEPSAASEGSLTDLTPGNRASPIEHSATIDIALSLGDRYRVRRLLGVGGMGEVFLAYDAELNREVAIKLIRGDIEIDTDLLERFRREIRLSSSITHRNVLRVYDLGEFGGRRFLSMQYIDGDDLSVLLRKGRLPLDDALRIFRQVCEGLKAAHEQNVIHRDLKPQNILIERSGRVFITDFGLAKMTSHTSSNDIGKVIGSPQYMSPEQVRGAEVDHRTDIYSLGLVSYRMLTGTLPFSGETPLEIMVQRLRVDPKPADSVVPDLPKHLVHIVDRCLAADPDHRYPSVDAILQDLDEAKYTDSVAFAIARNKRWRVPAIVAVAVLVLTLGAGGTWLFVNRGDAVSSSDSERKTVKVLIAGGSHVSSQSAKMSRW